MAHKFEAPKVIYTGRGAHNHLKSLDILEGKKCALMVIDPSSVDPELEECCKQDINSMGIDVAEYREVLLRATPDDIEAGLKLLKSAGCDIVIGMGGCGAIQASKLIGLLATNDGSIHEFTGINRSKHPALPVITIAVTAGSGRAIASCACFIDPQNRINCCVHDHHLIPEVAILDPGLNAWQSPQDTARDGVVSLAYAVESITSTLSTPVTDACALAAITATARWLPVAYAHGHDLDAREQMMFAQQLVSMAVCNCYPSILCRLAGQIEARTHIPFGDSVAVLMPQLLELYAEAVPEKVDSIGSALRNGMFQSTDGGMPVGTTDQFLYFLEQLDLSLQLSFMGMEESVIPEIAMAVSKGELLNCAPLSFDEDTVSELLKKAF